MDCIDSSNHKQTCLGNLERLPGSTIPTQVLEAMNFSHDIHPLVKRKPTLESLGFSRGAVWELGVGMHAGAGCISPASLVWGPGGDGPSSSLAIVAGNVRSNRQLVVVSLNFEPGESAQHDAVLNPQNIQGFLSPVVQPHFHDQPLFPACNAGAKINAIG
jgi:hypothetical protein